MHPMRQIEEIKSALPGGEEGAAEIRAAARSLEEAGVAAAETLAAVAEGEFPAALIVASRDCDGPEKRAWLTLAAAGPRRARQVLAWRASQLLDSAELASLALQRHRVRAQELARLAGAAGDSERAAWRLLAHLSGSELRAMVRARPALTAAFRRARAARGRVAPSALSPALGVG
ncbi:MAG TPA: hypothetical protein VF245_00830 [Solirubrobacterales bacterium]